MIAWATVERALRAWIVTAAGLPPERVVWAAQGAQRPTGPGTAWISLRIVGIRRRGHDGLTYAEVVDPDPGAEVEFRARGVRECTLSIQCFGGAVGDDSAQARLDRVVSTVHLPSARAALQVASVGIARFSQVRTVDGFLGAAVFEPRAQVDATFFLAQEVVELGTFIETVELDPEPPLPGDAFVVPE